MLFNETWNSCYAVPYLRRVRRLLTTEPLVQSQARSLEIRGERHGNRARVLPYQSSCRCFMFTMRCAVALTCYVVGYRVKLKCVAEPPVPHYACLQCCLRIRTSSWIVTSESFCKVLFYLSVWVIKLISTDSNGSLISVVAPHRHDSRFTFTGSLVMWHDWHIVKTVHYP
jgi:hypothetical protein